NLSPYYLPFAWDDKVAFHGKRSLRVDWDAKNRRGVFSNASDSWVDNHIGCDTPDLEDGKPYTFSFYAKAEHDGAPLAIWLMPNAAWGYFVDGCHFNRTFKLTTQWQRYSVTFRPKLAKNAPVKGYTCLFGFKKAKPGKFWIDAVQLDAGEKASEYQPSAPMSCGICLDVPAGQGDLRNTLWSVYYPSDKITGTVRVVSNDGKGGKLTVRTIDWLGKTVSEFSRDVNGGETIPLKFDSNLRGWFKTVAAITRGGKEIVRHTANHMVIDQPAETVPGIEPFFGLISSFHMLPLMKRIGVKRVQINQPWKTTYTPGLEPKKGQFDFRGMDHKFALAKAYGMKVKFAFSGNNVPEWYYDPKLVAEVKKYPRAINYLFTSESVAAWKKVVSELAKRYGSQIDTFELGGEDNGRIGSSSYYRAKHPEWLVDNWICRGPVFDLFYDAVSEAADGLRKQYPDMKISVVRPSEGREGDNWTFVRSVFAKIGKKYDTFGIDTYMLNPYSVGPDIKAHNGSVDGREWTWNLLQEFIRKYGCNQKLFISEASLECDTRCPDESVWQRQRAELMAKDFLISRALGFYAYDLFSALSPYTVGKYTFNMYQNHRVQMALPAVCQAARLVENAVKTRYIRLPGAARITLYKKHDGSGTAAVWADQGYFFHPADAKALCVMDMMGNVVQPDKNGRYTLGIYPLLISGAKYEAMENSIVKGEVAQSDFCRMFCDVRQKDTLTFRIENTSNRKDLRMALEVRSDAGKHEKDFTVAASGRRTFSLPASGSKAVVTMRRTDSPATATREIELSKPIALKQKPVKFAEVSEKFHLLPNEPWTPWSGPEDFSAKFFGSWNEKYLQIDVDVTDDLHCAAKPRPWECDSLQVAIDPKSNAGLQQLSPGVLGRDDVEFGVAAAPDGKLKCAVSFGRKDLFEPGDVTVVRDEAKKQTRYRIRVRWSKMDVEPKRGMVFGMSLVLFDDDAGNGPEYFAQIGGGITKRKDPRKYLKFVLE
ncbi:MAG: beta-galactosidase, partial [Lentisphaeria bacterium]|nr:beta-galactosidase [Lentisphaeria bacterium]